MVQADENGWGWHAACVGSFVKFVRFFLPILSFPDLIASTARRSAARGASQFDDTPRYPPLVVPPTTPI